MLKLEQEKFEELLVYIAKESCWNDDMLSW